MNPVVATVINGMGKALEQFHNIVRPRVCNIRFVMSRLKAVYEVTLVLQLCLLPNELINKY